MNDPLRTAALRATALAAWSAHPARFREDANSEEDHARGYYRDRVVVELAQNAADAAARAGVPGRLLLRLVASGDRTLLVAANTGAPLDADGVVSLASLRASAKRDATTVGRFGVGFAAVRSVADEISLVSGGVGVHFSLDVTRELLAGAGAGVPELAEEVARRGDSLPVLRLPLPGPAPGHEAVAGAVGAAGADGADWDTVVVLTLRDAAAVAEVRAQLDAVDDVLLLALPALVEVTVGERVLRDVGQRWLVATRSGVLDPALLADRPVEERERIGWQVTWAVRRGGPTEPATVHAPTPTDEPCTVPARLIGTFPLDPTRRHVAPGPLTDALVAEAGRVWSDLLAAMAGTAGGDLVDLLPGGMPAGALDAALREAVLAATRTAAVLTPAGGGPLVAAADAVVLTDPVDPAAARLLGRSWPALVDLAPARRRLVRLLGIPTMDLADVVGGLPTRSPVAARELYDAFAGADPATLEQLGTMPVPLVDGRTVHGARGLLLLEADPGSAALTTLAGWGLRVAHPDAAHPLLERLGAERTSLAGLLRSPVVRDRVLDEPESGETLLALVEAALRAGPLEPEAWWGEVLLPASDGELVPARGLVLGDSDAHDHLDAEVLPAVDAGLQERWGGRVLAALGVRSGLASLRVPLDLAGSADLAESLDGWSEYLQTLEGLDGPDEVEVVADLDAVLPHAWPGVLIALAADHRQALAPLRVRGPGGRAGPDGSGGSGAAPSYTTWWLRTRSPLDLAQPFAVGHGAPTWLRPAPASVAAVDRVVQGWLGGVATADDIDADGWAAILAGRDADEAVPTALAVGLWRALAGLAPDRLGALADTDLLPALTAGGVLARAADDVAVASPMWAQRTDCLPAVVVPDGAVTAVAVGMDLDRADERADGVVTSRGEPAPTPDAVLAVFPAAPATWAEHEDLRVDGAPVDWWVDGRDRVHAATTAGLARGLAEVVGPRHVDRIARLVADPRCVDQVLLELAGE